MRRYKAAASSTRRSRALLALLLGTTLGLAGCGSIDDALFGGDTASDQSAPSTPQATADQSGAGMLPGAPEGTAPASAGPVAAGITPVTIEGTFNVAGAVDEDHRQLTVLRDETDQVIVIIDSLLTSISETVQRQTTYVANERASLTTLASAIKAGSYYGDLGGPSGGVASVSFVGGPVSGPALVTIRFDHPHVDYQQILYTAVAQALQSRPGSGFAVVAVSPTRGTAAAVQLAQTDAERHARDVVRSLSDMGVPANHLNMSSSTDPGIGMSEVRVYVR